LNAAILCDRKYPKQNAARAGGPSVGGGLQAARMTALCIDQRDGTRWMNIPQNRIIREFMSRNSKLLSRFHLSNVLFSLHAESFRIIFCDQG